RRRRACRRWWPPVGPLRDGNSVRCCLALKASGGVDDVAGHDARALLGLGAERHQRLTRVDAHPYPERDAGVLLVEVGNRLQDPKRCPHRSLSVVCHRAPKTAITASPMSFSTVPPNCSTTSRSRA